MLVVAHDRSPRWLARVTARVPTAQGDNVRVDDCARPAAVLVLLIDSEEAPELLLTERAAALSDYPGHLVFPGGAVQHGDHGPEGTAIREAMEEIGLQPAAIHVVRVLPTLVLQPPAFAVTPVLGWCTTLEPTGTVNPDEVAAIVRIPLRELETSSTRVQRLENQGQCPARLLIDGRPVGPMTTSIIDLLVGRR